ncbi:MAG: hypothetical protein JNM84_28120 [Planctomycetes bacterium]|nr:hypothetical protein [Planctomycetota bacterium]
MSTASSPSNLSPPALPRLEDLLLAASAVALALGWWPNVLTGEPGAAFGALLVLLYVAEHYAFAHRSRRSLLQLRRSLEPRATDRDFDSGLAAPGYALLAGPLLRAAFRAIVLARGLVSLGVPERALESDAAAIAMAVLMLFELLFAGYWCLQVTTLGAPVPSKRGAPPATPVVAGAEGSRWKSLLDLAARRESRRNDLGADLVAALWSCAIFGSACQVFSADMARWSADSVGESPWFVGGALLCVTALLCLVLFVPLHLDTWAERERAVRTRGAWWRSRLGALCTMGLGLSPAYASFARHLLGIG